MSKRRARTDRSRWLKWWILWRIPVLVLIILVAWWIGYILGEAG